MLQTGATSSILETQITPTASEIYVAPTPARSYSLPALDPALLAATPPLNEHFDEMREAVADRRVIIVRQGGTIAIGTLVAILGSVVAHAALAVLVFFLWKIIIAIPSTWGPGNTSSLAHDGGRPGVSFTMLGQGDFTGTDTNPNLGSIAPAASSNTPSIVAPSTPAAHDDWPTLKGTPLADDPTPLIGLPTNLSEPSPHSFKTPIPPTPAAAPAPEQVTIGPVIVGPNIGQLQSNQTSTTAHGNAVISGTASIAKVGDLPGGESSDGDDEPRINIMRGNGGSGKGSGNGSGDGIDRGPSGANNEIPQILNLPRIDLPLKQMVTPVYGKTILAVFVQADGTPGEIRLIQSCGDTTLDAVRKTAVAQATYRPAYRNGKSFAAWTPNLIFSIGKAE